MIFVSGWAGFDYLYPNISKNFPFLVPFNGKWDEENIVKYLRKNQEEIIIGWSTGGHIMLKHIDKIKDNFSHIILISPFRCFMDFTNKKILDIMIENFRVNPQIVLEAFLKKAGAIYKPIEFNKESLLKGLEFLKYSRIQETHNPSNLHVVHGKKDRIVPFKEAFRITEKPIILDNKPHYLDENTINQICYEITTKKIV